MSRELYMRRIKNAYEASYRCEGGSWGRGYWNSVVEQLHRNYWRGIEKSKNDEMFQTYPSMFSTRNGP